MPFQSPTFLILFLPAVLLAYHGLALCCRQDLRAQNVVLFLASVGFYAWGEGFQALVLVGSLVLNFTFGRLAARWPGVISWLAIGTNVAVLVNYKYAAFLYANWLAITGSTTPLPVATALPLGLSFFTFQAISYVLDVARNQVPAERHVIRFGVYVFLFPHLIAGPIVRYQHLAGQLRERRTTLDTFTEGLRRFAIGLAKKLVLANSFAVLADEAFRYSPLQLAPGAAWLGLLAYTLQIYFDFSGYSCMAIGLAKLFGFEFHENFRQPYIATSVSEFWRRWHISLSSWFRDYVFIPLGGSRRSRWITRRNLLIVFVLCGLWHGANWTFLVWGLLHGTLLIVERLGGNAILQQLWRPLRHLYTLLAVMLAWVFFRAESLSSACGYLGALFGFGSGSVELVDLWSNRLVVLLPLGIAACLPWPRWFAEPDTPRTVLMEAVTGLARLATVVLCLTSAWMQLAAGTHVPFIYFRF